MGVSVDFQFFATINLEIYGKKMEIQGNLQMSHPVMDSYCMLAGISFMNAVVGSQLLVILLVSSLPILQALPWRNVVLHFSVHNIIHVQLGWNILQV